MIRWFATNGIAANFLLIAIVFAGVYTAFFKIPLEVTPSREYGSVRITMPYRGGTAKDVEKGILIPIEKALEGVNGIKMVHADGYRDFASLWVEAVDGYDLRVLMDDVKARVDQIPNFPREAERPRIYIPNTSQWKEVLTVAITGNLNPHQLRDVARRVQEQLLEIPGISQVELKGEKDPEVSIEADPEKLQAFNLGLRDLAEAIRRSSIDLPAGSIQSDSGTLMIRTRGQAFRQEEFENIIVRASNGARVRLSEVATIKDGFVEGDTRHEFNGVPALFVEVMRTGNENAIEISNNVHKYVESAKTKFPEGINLYIWDDESVSIRGRLGTLSTSLIQGCILVFLILGLFLRPQVAFWVVMGIPVSFAGGIMLMPYLGVTANVMSLFGFIIVLGLVVDDAIVTGENIFSKLKTGMDPLEASVKGTEEVTVPVTFGILTTVVAFLPLYFFEGHWGEFAKQIPPVVAPVLLFSLVESKLILPSHLKHLRVGRKNINFLGRIQKSVAEGLEWFVGKVYEPTLKWGTRHRYIVVSCFITMALLMLGYCQGGRLGFVSIPNVDRLRVTAYIHLPNDASDEKVRSYIDRIASKAEILKQEFQDPKKGPLILNVLKVSGARRAGSWYEKTKGLVSVEVMPPSIRSEPGPKNHVIAKRWRELIGEIPEAITFNVWGEQTKGGRDDQDQQPIELELRGATSEKKNEIARKISDLFKAREDIAHSWSRINYGQEELEFTLKPRALELGITQQNFAQQVRQAFYGEEAQRILRGYDDLRVMVRLPVEARKSLHTLDRLKIRTPVGAEIPLATVASVSFVRAPSSVERNAGAEVIRIGAQPADESVDIIKVANELDPQIQELAQEGDNLSVQYTGFIAEHEESQKRTILGSIALMFTLFALLAIPFKSLVQPIFVLLAVPFGIIGALLGHIILGITPSYLSIFGMLALAGVVVNDSLVMVDYVNRRVKSGDDLDQAVLNAGARRFRPIILTSVTTFVGLVPLLMEKSLQAQFLIPMAVSLGAGILFSTAITLYLIPCSQLIAKDIGEGLKGFKNWFLKPFSVEAEAHSIE